MKVELLKQELLNSISDYNEESVNEILKAFELANDLHSNQKRENSEIFLFSLFFI